MLAGAGKEWRWDAFARSGGKNLVSMASAGLERKVFKKHLVVLSAMEHISIKLESVLARQMEKDMKDFKYSTKTEFIRDAIRSKVHALEEERSKKKAWDALFAARGIFKGKGKAKTDEEWHAWRKENSDKLVKELAEKYGWKL